MAEDLLDLYANIDSVRKLIYLELQIQKKQQRHTKISRIQIWNIFYIVDTAK